MIADVSTFMTLEPGDILATGTPVKLPRESIESPGLSGMRNGAVAER